MLAWPARFRCYCGRVGPNGCLAEWIKSRGREIDEPYRQASLMLKRRLIFVRCLLCCNDGRSANVDIKEFPSCVPGKM